MQGVLDQPAATYSVAVRSAVSSAEAIKYRVSKWLLSFSRVRELTRTMVVAAGRRSSQGKRRWYTDGNGSFLDAAMRLVEIDDGVEAIGGSVVEIALDLGSGWRLVGLDGEQVLGAGTPDDLCDGGMVAMASIETSVPLRPSFPPRRSTAHRIGNCHVLTSSAE